MKLKLSELKPNPFKKFIRNGEMDEARLDVLKESIEHGTLPEHFFARNNDGAFELTSGHHRHKALSDMKGIDYIVDVTPVNFSDEQMLIDMVRENITQRDTDFHDTAESIVLARNWLQSKATTVNQFNSSHKTGTRKKGVSGCSESLPDSFRSIATFLSKNGKAASHVTVKTYLDIKDKVSPDIVKNVHKVGGGKAPENVVTMKQAIELSKIDDEEEQHDVLEAMKREESGRPHELITAYKNAPDEVKQKIRKGEINLSDVENASIEQDIKNYNKDNPRFEFIPNFAGRLKQFDKDVYVLEKQVRAFSMVFHDKRFKEKYEALKPKQKTSLHGLISDISKRVKKCYDEVEYFKKIIDRNVGLLEDKK